MDRLSAAALTSATADLLEPTKVSSAASNNKMVTGEREVEFIVDFLGAMVGTLTPKAFSLP